MTEKLCILDIETTGFEPENSEILELYILKVADNEIIDEFYSLFKPNQKIEILISMESLMRRFENAPAFQEMDNEITNFVEDTILVGHNINYFDLKFLNYYLAKTIKK